MQINKITKKICIPIAILLVVVIVFLLFFNIFSNKEAASLSIINDIGFTINTPENKVDTITLSEEGYTEIANVANLTLEFSKEYGVFKVTNSNTNQIWSTAYNHNDIEEYSGRHKRLLTSLLSVSYTDTEGNDNTISSTDNSVNCEYKFLENGIEILFDFTEQGFVIPLQVWLEDNGFYACIPDALIKETSKDYILMSVDVLPAFGAMMSGDDGYLVYPDGCGTILECKNTAGKSGIVTANVFSTPFSAEVRSENEIKVALPYFGSITNNQYGIAGYILSGGQNSRISLSIGNKSLPINKIYSTAIYRYEMEAKTSKGKFVALTERVTDVSFCVHYSLLDKTQADYSGIANSVRTLMENKGYFKNQNISSQTKTYIELIMSVENKKLSSSSIISMTTYEQAYNIVNQLSKNNEVIVNLMGWQEEGYAKYPSKNKFSKNLGDKNALSNLFILSDKNNVNILVNTDYVRAAVSSKNLNTRSDIINNLLDQPIISEDQNNYLRNIRMSYKDYIDDLDYLKDYKLQGIAFDSFSDYIAGDYSTNRFTTAAQAVKFYEVFLKTASEKGYFTASQGGNDYLLKYSDFIYNIPEYSSKLEIWNEEIPMLQMILHGKIKYAGCLAGNMSSDYKKSCLEWAEMGMSPYFIMTNQSSSVFNNSNIDDIYNSKFADWEKEITKISEDFNKRLLDVSTSVIVKHEKINDEIACVTYENGYKVYVNYSDKDFSIDNCIVPASDFIVVK